MRIAHAGQPGQPDVAARPVDAVVAAALDLIECGKAGEARLQLKELLAEQEPAARCRFVARALHELRQGRPWIARRHLLAAQERGL